MNDTCILAQGTLVQGDVFVGQSLRIEGEIQGNVSCKERLVCSASGQIVGDVRCKNALIEGKIQGNLECEDSLELSATAQVIGNIKAKRLQMQFGAIIKGKCEMPL